MTQRPGHRRLDHRIDPDGRGSSRPRPGKPRMTRTQRMRLATTSLALIVLVALVLSLLLPAFAMAAPRILPDAERPASQLGSPSTELTSARGRSSQLIAASEHRTATRMTSLSAARPTSVQAPKPPPSSQDVAWADRGQLMLSAEEALAALDALPADNPAEESWGEDGRLRWFGESWTDVDGNGCDTRNEILARDLTDLDYSRRDGRQTREQGRGQGVSICPDATVFAGTLHDPYTDTTVQFQRGADTSESVQIDHIVPLNYLYAHGAWAWDERSRLLAANDPLNLLAVEGQANQDKSNCGPATCPAGNSETGTWRTEAHSGLRGPVGADGGYWPQNDAYRCEYAQRFVSVLAAYQLGIPDDDDQALRRTLSDCIAGGNGATTSAASGADESLERNWPTWLAIAGGVIAALVGAHGASVRRSSRKVRSAVKRAQREMGGSQGTGSWGGQR